MPAYILPPIEAERINTTEVPFGITEAMLISSSVTETDHPAWASGAHVAEDLVIRTTASTHSIYRCTVDVTGAIPPEDDPDHWDRVSATNRWGMYDMLANNPTVASGSLEVILAPGRISSLVLLDVIADTVSLEMVESGAPGAAVVWAPDDVNLDNTPINSWDDYFFSPFSLATLIVRLDVPTYTSGRLKITLTGAGTVSLGKCVVGSAIHIGRTQYNARIRRRSFAEITRDKYGELLSIVAKKSIPLVSATTDVDREDLLPAKMALDKARVSPCVLVGLLPDEAEYAELLTFAGLCSDYDINLSNVDAATIGMEFEGA